MGQVYTTSRRCVSAFTLWAESLELNQCLHEMKSRTEIKKGIEISISITLFCEVDKNDDGAKNNLCDQLQSKLICNESVSIFLYQMIHVLKHFI